MLISLLQKYLRWAIGAFCLGAIGAGATWIALNITETAFESLFSTVQFGHWLAPIATLTVGAFGACVALMGLHTTAAVNLRNKRIDVIMSCNARYDDLYKVKTKLIYKISKQSSDAVVSADEGNIDNIDIIDNHTSEIESNDDKYSDISHEVELYYRRFWGLKSDQVDYWLAGYIDPETVISWFMSTVEAVHNPAHSLTGFEQAKLGGWEYVKDFHMVTNPRLYQIGEEITQQIFGQMGQAERYGRLYKLFKVIEEDEKSWIDLLAKNSRSRLTIMELGDSLPSIIKSYVN